VRTNKQRRLDCFEEIVAGHRLFEELDGAGRQRDCALPIVAVAREKHDRQWTARRIEGRLHFESRHARHVNVEDEAIRPRRVFATKKFVG